MQTVVVRYFFRISVLIALLWGKNVLLGYKDKLDNLYNFFHSIMEFLLLLTILNIVTALMIMAYRLRKKLPYKYTDNVITGINNLYYIIVTFGVLTMILGFWGKDIKTLLTSLSIVAAAIAIISKEYVGGVISGIIISFSKEINIDDYVKIGEHKGKILDITLNKVTLINDDDDIIYISNDKVYMSEIINYTKSEIRKVNIEFEIDVNYNHTIESLEKNLVLGLKEFHPYIEVNSFGLKIVSIKHDYISLKFHFQLKEVNREVEKNIRKKTASLLANSILAEHNLTKT